MSNDLKKAVAHTPNSFGQWHLLVDHLSKVEKLAGQFGEEAGIGIAASGLAGLWHDLGKLSPQFQKYLQVAENDPERAKADFRVGHKTAGALWSQKEAGVKQCFIRQAALPLAILGHHGGIPNYAELEELAAVKDKKEIVEALSIACENRNFFSTGSTDFWPESWKKNLANQRSRSRCGQDFFIRLLFSCLVDADSLDTESHFDPQRSAARLHRFVSLGELSERLESNLSELVKDRQHDRVTVSRNAIAASVCKKVHTGTGLFTLTAPTGAGKTIASLRFALAHGRKHGLRRIVMAVPFISITEQNAEVFRKLLADPAVVDAEEVVLEHHSNVGHGTQNEWRLRLRSQNWDATVIVTTSVQLLESLFSNRPGKCRTVHRLAEAVVLIDEVQSIPWELLDPTCLMLRDLCEFAGSSVVLMTATQPPVQKLPSLKQAKPVELLDNTEHWFSQFNRVKVAWDGEPRSWEEMASIVTEAAAKKAGQALVVVNTIKDAVALTQSMDDASALLHLSTRLCAAHRGVVLKEVRRRLDAGEPVVLVSTQVVEAGVDISFPVGFRALGPATSIAQVEGRINRHGNAQEEAILHVFDPADGRTPPGMYKKATDETRKLLNKGVAVTSPEGIENFYDQLVVAFKTQLDAKGVSDSRKHLSFKEVAEKYKLIADETVSVIVRYGDTETLDTLLALVDSGTKIFREVARKLQPWLVSLRQKDFDDALAAGLIQEHRVAVGMHVWVGEYDDTLGLIFEAKSHSW